jgi:hypothetical protein
MTHAERGKMLAEAHVDWQLYLLRPLLVSYFEHGFKHGIEECAETPQEQQNVPVSPREGGKAYQGEVVKRNGYMRIGLHEIRSDWIRQDTTRTTQKEGNQWHPNNGADYE